MSFFDHIFKTQSQNAFINDLTDTEKISKELFDISPEAILLLDKNGKIIKANDRLYEWLGRSRESFLGRKIQELDFLPEESRQKIITAFKSRMRGHDVKPYEISFTTSKGEEFYGNFHASLVRDRAGKIAGEIVMISNTTDIKQAFTQEKLVYEDLEKLSNSAIGFAELKPRDDIYLFIGKKLLEMLPSALVFINKFSPESNTMEVVHFMGLDKKYESAVKLLKAWPTGQAWPISTYAQNNLKSLALNELPGGVHELAQGRLPKTTSALITKMLGVTKIYSIGFAWDDHLFGTATVVANRKTIVRPETMSAFVHQASVALRRNQAEAELQKAHDELEIRVEERTVDLKKTAQDLEKFRLAVKDASDQIIITDPTGKILFANQAAKVITGYAEKEMVGKTPALWGGLMPGSYYDNLWATIKSGQAFRGELTNKRKDGREFVAELHISPVLDDGNEILFYVGILRDVTKAKEVDQAKTEFVSLASHQLRTPLSAINWYTEMLLNGDAGEITTNQQNYLKEIYNGSQRMVDLVNSLLNVSRLELGTFIVEPEKSSLKSICLDVIKELRVQIEKKKQVLETHFEEKIPSIMADPKLTRIIFQNLLSNATKYTPDKGRISVSITFNPKNDQEIMIKVSDTGYGIPKYQQDKIFTKLFRADNVKKMETEGTGLGVYIIKQIIDNAGGEIWFESAEGSGTKFFITFPLSGMKKKEGSRELS